MKKLFAVMCVCAFLALVGCGKSPEVKSEVRETEPTLSPTKFAEVLVVLGYAKAGSDTITTDYGTIGADGRPDWGSMLDENKMKALERMGITTSLFAESMEALTDPITGNRTEYAQRVFECLKGNRTSHRKH